MKLGMQMLELPGFRKMCISSYSEFHGIVVSLGRDKRMEVATLFLGI